MAANFAFQVSMEDPNDVIKNGFNLCVSKAAGDGPTVQWLSITPEGKNISVQWWTDYMVYFTTTQEQQGAVIQQDSSAPAFLGKAYEYSDGTFKLVDAMVPVGSIKVFNKMGATRNFGLAQNGKGGSDPAVMAPLAMTAVFNQGFAEFIPRETVVVYFSSTVKYNGAIVNSSSSSFSLTIVAGKTPILEYSKNGTWSIKSDNAQDGAGAAPVPRGISPLHAVETLYLVQALIQTSLLLPVRAVAEAVHAFAEQAGIVVLRQPRPHDHAERLKFVFAGKDMHALVEAVYALQGTQVQNMYRIPTRGGHKLVGTSASVDSVFIDEGKPAIVAWNNGVRRIDL